MGHGRGQGNKQEGSFGKGVHHSCFATRRCVNGLEGGRSKVSGESLRAGWPFVWIARVEIRVSFNDRTGQTGRVRYRYIGPVWSKTGRYWWSSNLNSNFVVQPVRTGIPAGLTGLPVGLTGNRPNSNCFSFLV